MKSKIKLISVKAEAKASSLCLAELGKRLNIAFTDKKYSLTFLKLDTRMYNIKEGLVENPMK